jgi:hypothetical protein
LFFGSPDEVERTQTYEVHSKAVNVLQVNKFLRLVSTALM